jgi:hypothetical protein
MNGLILSLILIALVFRMVSGYANHREAIALIKWMNTGVPVGISGMAIFVNISEPSVV